MFCEAAGAGTPRDEDEVRDEDDFTSKAKFSDLFGEAAATEIISLKPTRSPPGLVSDAAAETAPDSQEAADDAEAQPQSKAERRAVETLSVTGNRP